MALDLDLLWDCQPFGPAYSGNFFMLWAWQNGGEKEKKEKGEKEEGEKKRKREERLYVSIIIIKYTVCFVCYTNI